MSPVLCLKAVLIYKVIWILIIGNTIEFQNTCYAHFDCLKYNDMVIIFLEYMKNSLINFGSV